MIQEYFAKNHPAGTLEQLTHVLSNKPFIGGSHSGSMEEKQFEENLTLIFPDGSHETLNYEGSVYDYNILGRERYSCQLTTEQIENIIQKRKEEPLKVIYQINDNEDSKKSFGPIEVPYDKIKEIINLRKGNI